MRWLRSRVLVWVMVKPVFGLLSGAYSVSNVCHKRLTALLVRYGKYLESLKGEIYDDR
jgi:hypothetical protein